MEKTVNQNSCWCDFCPNFTINIRNQYCIKRNVWCGIYDIDFSGLSTLLEVIPVDGFQGFVNFKGVKRGNCRNPKKLKIQDQTRNSTLLLLPY